MSKSPDQSQKREPEKDDKDDILSIISDLRDKVDKQTDAISRIEKILTVNDRPVEISDWPGRHPHWKYSYPPEMRKKYAFHHGLNESLAYVAQSEHIPTALSTMQHDINALTVRVDGVFKTVHKLDCNVQKLRDHQKKKRPPIKSSEEPETKKKRDDSTKPDEPDDDAPDGYTLIVEHRAV